MQMPGTGGFVPALVGCTNLAYWTSVKIPDGTEIFTVQQSSIRFARGVKCAVNGRAGVRAFVKRDAEGRKDHEGWPSLVETALTDNHAFIRAAARAGRASERGRTASPVARLPKGAVTGAVMAGRDGVECRASARRKELLQKKRACRFPEKPLNLTLQFTRSCPEIMPASGQGGHFLQQTGAGAPP
jgi:hypothetical protein